MQNKCENCVYYQVVDEYGYFVPQEYCYFNPPIAGVKRPKVNSYDFCSEFKSKPGE